MTEGLHSDSKFYGSEINWYVRLSDAEDSSGNVSKFLSPYVRGKRVLDFGSGTGKYIPLLSPLAMSYFCFDKSSDALNTARERARSFQNVKILESNTLKIPIQSRSLDLVIACWVFGTINNESERVFWLDECKRLLSDNGEILLIENDIGGEFEKIRGRFPDSSRTVQYNDWLINRGGFKFVTRFNTEFCFPSVSEARSVFGAIWGDSASKLVQESRIDHRIVVYGYKG